MRLAIDNTDYTAALDSEHLPAVTRRLNQADEMRFWLIAASDAFVVPAPGATVVLEATSGTLFAGQIAAAPEHEYLGWGERGPQYRYQVQAVGAESNLDEKLLPERAPFTCRSAGEILRAITEDLLPGRYDLSGIEDVEALPYFASRGGRWSQAVAALCLRIRGVYRAHAGAVSLRPVGGANHVIDEASPGFCPQSLRVRRVLRTVNDLTAAGNYEPAAYVKDYFVGDGITLNFGLSHTPFTSRQATIVEDEFAGSELDPRLWAKADPAHAVTVENGALRIAGGTGADGGTTVRLAEEVELGGALLLQHGAAAFSAASDGVLGGLYEGGVTMANCIAGFRVTPSGAQSSIVALVNGAPRGAALLTVAGHRYCLTTRIYATEFYRRRQMFHSSLHPAGAARGGEDVASDMRLVLEVHDVDPANPGSEAAVSTVLYDEVLPAVPGFCTYAPVNAAAMHVSLTFLRMARQISAEVRSAFPGQGYKTRLIGYIDEGGECRIFDTPELHFHAEHVPAGGEKIVVAYRASGRAIARVTDPASIAALGGADDDGVRAAVMEVQQPAARTAEECELAALAALDDMNAPAWSGSYRADSDQFAEEPVPGESVTVHVPSREVDFTATLREVEMEVADLTAGRLHYTLRFANDASASLSLKTQPSSAYPPKTAATLENAGSSAVASLPEAGITLYDSVSVTIDAGCDPPPGGGIEVRRSDTGWGTGRERNLIGRFAARTFTIVRLARTQGCYLRLYDSEGRYSRYSAVLHLDCPL